MYRTWLMNSHLRFRLSELTGKVLGCHCAPKPCHANILAHMANTPFIVNALGQDGPYRVLVCGSREWNSPARIRWALAAQVRPWLPHVVLVHGGARGADQMAGEIATHFKWPTEVFPADWRYGKQAGQIRNSLMIATRPVVVFAFGRGSGTNNCVDQARLAGIEVIRRHPEWPV